MKSLLKVLAFIPLCIELLLLLTIFPKKAMGVVGGIHIVITVLLTVVGIGIVSRKRFIQQIGIMALVALTLLLGIMGYSDFVKWFSSIVGVAIFIYFTFLSIAIKKLAIS
ncbi:hypothetical protein [Clostridium sp.]|uniref:hypothetical protein n=1 Tax=Clostridium sp. TaxID=1506 RepID=UPI003F3F5B9D